MEPVTFPALLVYCTMLRFALSIVLALPADARIVPGLTLPPSGGNQ
jgi:hypothetical protein